VSLPLGLVNPKGAVCLGPILPHWQPCLQLFAIRLTGPGTEHRTLHRASNPDGPAGGPAGAEGPALAPWLVRGHATDQCLTSQYRHRTEERLSSSFGLSQTSYRQVYPSLLYYPNADT